MRNKRRRTRRRLKQLRPCSNSNRNTSKRSFYHLKKNHWSLQNPITKSFPNLKINLWNRSPSMLRRNMLKRRMPKRKIKANLQQKTNHPPIPMKKTMKSCSLTICSSLSESPWSAKMAYKLRRSKKPNQRKSLNTKRKFPRKLLENILKKERSPRIPLCCNLSQTSNHQWMPAHIKETTWEVWTNRDWGLDKGCFLIVNYARRGPQIFLWMIALTLRSKHWPIRKSKWK